MEGKAYEAFASVYNEYMNTVDYEAYGKKLVSILKDGIDRIPAPPAGEEDERTIVVDAGCGTGRMTAILAEAGFDMIGIDSSEEMLLAAREALPSGLFLCQDMSELELFGNAGAFVSTMDALNYLLQEEEVKSFFARVQTFLLPSGLFVLDFHPDAYYRAIGDRTIAETHEQSAFIWNNHFYETAEEDDGTVLTALNEFELHLFLREEGSEDTYRRTIEYHYQRGYRPEFLKEAGEAAGLELLGMEDALTGEAVTADTARILAVFRKPAGEKP